MSSFVLFLRRPASRFVFQAACESQTLRFTAQTIRFTRFDPAPLRF